MGDGAGGVAPDLGAGALVVGPRVVGVGELVQHLALALRLHGLGQVARALHARLAAHQHDLGAEGLHGGAPFQAHVRGHDQHHAVALHGRGHGQGDAGIAAGGLDEGVAGADLAARLGVADHAQGRAVLDRTGRVVALQLDQDAVAGGTGQALQAHQRGVADEVFQGSVVHRTSVRIHAAKQKLAL